MSWLLGVLIIFATLDKIPDPAATSPKAHSISVSVHEHSIEATAVRIFVAAAPEFRLPAEALVSAESSPIRQSDVLIDYAADSSPPLA